MNNTETQPEKRMPSRTSIMVAAARAFGSREPDESVRNPDMLADHLIGDEELALIAGHPLSQGLRQDYHEASQNPAIVGLAWMMLLRTRFIDDALCCAVKKGATQIVLLGAGFDTRAHRFRELLKDCLVIEVDAAPTQHHKRRRLASVVSDEPPNLIYLTIDFATGDLGDALRSAGLRSDEKTFYIWEGVSMYLTEEGIRKTLAFIASHSAPGSSVVLDYFNSLGIEYMKLAPPGAGGGDPSGWGEPWLFGAPAPDGAEFFRELGFDPGQPVSMYNPELVKRYTIGKNGIGYGANVFEKTRAAAIEARARTEAEPDTPEKKAAADFQKAIAAAGGTYWLAELTVPAH
ncbi:MAG: SAM-dependent methyltransferase [Terracidiphilus sp.]|jgi:methyltransferase (TIGR00027 family)